MRGRSGRQSSAARDDWRGEGDRGHDRGRGGDWRGESRPGDDDREPAQDADELGRLLHRQHDVIGFRQARRAPTAATLRNRVDSGRWRAVHPA